MKCFFKILCAAIILPLIINCGINTADGGGVIVNNPSIVGYVRFPEGQGAYGAIAMIAPKGVQWGHRHKHRGKREILSLTITLKLWTLFIVICRAVFPLKIFSW